MRTRFHENLDQLTAQLQAMCVRDRTALATATNALLHADLELAEQAIDICREIDQMRDDCEHAAVTLLALQAPVASELRQVVTAIQLVGDLLRMGALSRQHRAPPAPGARGPRVRATDRGPHGRRRHRHSHQRHHSAALRRPARRRPAR
jgi:hypothetical protein